MKETLKRRVKALSLVFLVVLLTVTMLPTTAFAASKKVPSKVSVTKVSASTSSVKVSWKKAKDATSYRIYYRPSTTRKWTSLTTVSSKTTSYTHKNSRKYPLKAGQKYYYTVRAYNKYSKKWGQYNTTGKAVVIPSVPGMVKISSVKADGTNKVNIRWNKISNATSYRIYYRPSTTRKWTAVKTVSSKTTSYTHVSSKLKAGKKYYYTVRAYNQNSKKWGRYDATGKSVTMQKPSHKHSWKTEYTTVTHDAVYENQPVYEYRPVYKEEPVYENQPVYKWVAYHECRKCGAQFEDSQFEELGEHCLECDSTYTTKEKQVQTGTQSVQVGTKKVQVGTNKVQVGTEKVKVKDAWTEQVPNGQVCTGCGAKK